METLVIKNTVRGGKNVEHDGDIIVMGDVYAGTNITAGGNITVMGKALGSLVAGTILGEDAVITVGTFSSPYIKIGKYSARQDAGDILGPEYLCVENGIIVGHKIKVK